jgi:hypothetical protein
MFWVQVQEINTGLHMTGPGSASAVEWEQIFLYCGREWNYFVRRRTFEANPARRSFDNSFISS